mmetsp:Transcript_9764/g.14990  ORF Transcript_9764/g.14990 Transcript_9764/m.14990 type:complete len:273 (-) Transcript_9764:152-970(-)|eukprot:CAMPEP_0195294668 /NCGR_PEP_ID=MMETSP0707-20130614/15671_1 /TAXON_ID=33640 /ORGANISM="Asterionellopsis glacialis, Strain CCMP134" /LENGTH=272 /DNA_ID=CAMNT_0040355705 /DNA_START=35 /DNA_END=853 /DNA_ORIENTATION=+
MTTSTINGNHELLGLKDAEWKMFQEQLRKGGHTTTMRIKEALKEHLKELDETSENFSTHASGENEDDVSLCESTSSSKMSTAINNLLPQVIRKTVTSSEGNNNDLGERLWKTSQTDTQTSESSKNIYEHILKAALDETDDNEWDGLWNKTTESEENVSANSKRRHSLMKKSKSSLSSNVIGTLRDELRRPQANSDKDLQARKRQRNNTGGVSELIVRMSSSNLLRTSPSGRALEPSFRNKASGEANATFADLDENSDNDSKGELLEPFGKRP